MNFSELPFLAESIEWVRANLYWIVLALVVHFSTLGAVAYLILLERKVASWAQDRIGPNRVGWYGLLQPIADGLKFITKEDYKPDKVDTVLYTIAPALMVIVVVVSVAVIPWGGIKGQRVTVDVTNALAEGAAPVEAVNARLPRSHRVIGDVEFFVLPATERVALPEFRRRDRTASFDEARRGRCSPSGPSTPPPATPGPRRWRRTSPAAPPSSAPARSRSTSPATSSTPATRAASTSSSPTSTSASSSSSRSSPSPSTASSSAAGRATTSTASSAACGRART